MLPKITAKIKLIMGFKMCSVSAVTIAVNALPIITPTARSITLPREMKVLNSLKNFLMITLLKKSQSDEPSLYNPISPALYHVECEYVNLSNRIIGK